MLKTRWGVSVFKYKKKVKIAKLKQATHVREYNKITALYLKLKIIIKGNCRFPDCVEKKQKSGNPHRLRVLKISSSSGGSNMGISPVNLPCSVLGSERLYNSRDLNFLQV